MWFVVANVSSQSHLYRINVACQDKSKVVCEKGKGNQAKLASCIYYFDGRLYGSTTPWNLYILQDSLWIVQNTMYNVHSTKWGFVIEIAALMMSSPVVSYHLNLQQLGPHFCDWSRIYWWYEGTHYDWGCQFATGVAILLGRLAQQNSIYSRPFRSEISFPSHVLLHFYASNIHLSSQQDKISTGNASLLLPDLSSDWPWWI
jgi:hypothetical protein